MNWDWTTVLAGAMLLWSIGLVGVLIIDYMRETRSRGNFKYYSHNRHNYKAKSQ